MIHVYLNEKLFELDSALTLAEFLKQNFGEKPQNFALVINNQHIPRGLYQTTVLQALDRIDLIVPMQGG